MNQMNILAQISIPIDEEVITDYELRAICFSLLSERRK